MGNQVFKKGPGTSFKAYFTSRNNVEMDPNTKD